MVQRFNQEYFWNGGRGVSGPSTFVGKICTHFLYKFTKVKIKMQTNCPLNFLSGPFSLKVKKNKTDDAMCLQLTSYHLHTQPCVIGQPTRVWEKKNQHVDLQVIMHLGYFLFDKGVILCRTQSILIFSSFNNRDASLITRGSTQSRR